MPINAANLPFSRDNGRLKGEFLTVREGFNFLVLFDLVDNSFQFLWHLLIVSVCRFHADESWEARMLGVSALLQKTARS